MQISFTYITNIYDWKKTSLSILANKPRYIGLDMEFERTTTYFPIPALLQIRAGTEIFLIDLVKIQLENDLKDFFDALNCPIVFFAGNQEVEILYHIYGIKLKNVFDCQLAAIFLNIGSQLGYQAIVKDILNIEVDKDSQRTNWLRRPLTQKQLNYAAIDVLHLEKLYQYFESELITQNKLAWFEEDCEKLAKPVIPNPSSTWKKFQYLSVNWQGFATVMAITKLREEFATKNNISRNRVIDSSEIENLAIIMQKQDLDSLPLVNPRNTKKYFIPEVRSILNELMQTFSQNNEKNKNLKTEVLAKMNNQRERMLDRSLQPLVNQLKKSLVKCAKDHILLPYIISNRENLVAFVARPQDLSNPLRSGWRWQVFGKEASEIIDSYHALKSANIPTPDVETCHQDQETE